MALPILRGRVRCLLASVLLVVCPTVHAEPMSWQDINALPQPEAGIIEPYGDAPQQFGELMMPARAVSDQRPLPVVIWIHGGCWFSEYDYRYTRPLTRAIADLGFAVWSIEYRRIGDPGGAWPGTFEDVAVSTDHLRALAKRYPLDLDQVIAAGHSAGGQLALWLAAREQLPDNTPLHAVAPLPIHAVIALAPAADLYRMSSEKTCGDSANKLLGGTPDKVPERYSWVSPTHVLPTSDALAVIDGELDALWEPISASFSEKVTADGLNIDRHVIPGAGHFDLVAPQGAAWDDLKSLLLNLVAGLKPATAQPE